jgi:replicative DNA helicase
MSLKLLKKCLDYTFYDQVQEQLEEDLFPREVRKVFDTLVDHFRFHSNSIAVTDLKALFFARFPSLSATEIRNYEILFDNLDKEEVSDDVAKSLLRLELVRNNASKVANEAINITDGKQQDLTKLRSLITLLDTTAKPVEEELVPVTSNLRELIELGKAEHKWKFPLDNLEEIGDGIGPGVFGIIAGRPNSGKTAFGISCIYHPQNGWAKQGAKVALFGTEERVFRHKKRGISCYTGMTEAEWTIAEEEATRIYAEIKDNILEFDVVGITLKRIEEWLDKKRPDIVVVDMLDKVRIYGEFGAKHDELRELYTQSRETAKKFDCAFVGMSQLSADAEGMLHPGADLLEGSKTGKYAEGDFIITIGKESLSRTNNVDTGFRMANFAKNKLTGKELSAPFMLNHNLSRIYK